MPLAVGTAATFRGFLVDVDAIEASVQLGESRRRVGSITLPSLDGPERH
ncbi:MAG TPA: hypothetical protein VFE60_08060 [Roseiarcus sp.]|nr:hypothetical protein [Roseiarcus sp.]